MVPVKSFLTGALCDYMKLIYLNLNEEDRVPECYSCMKLMIQAHLCFGFFKILFIKHVSLKRFY